MCEELHDNQDFLWIYWLYICFGYFFFTCHVWYFIYGNLSKLRYLVYKIFFNSVYTINIMFQNCTTLRNQIPPPQIPESWFCSWFILFPIIFLTKIILTYSDQTLLQNVVTLCKILNNKNIVTVITIRQINAENEIFKSIKNFLQWFQHAWSLIFKQIYFTL